MNSGSKGMTGVDFLIGYTKDISGNATEGVDMDQLAKQAPNTKKLLNQANKFLLVGFIAALIAFFILGWLAAIGVVCGFRALVLSSRLNATKNPRASRVRTLAILLVAGATLELVFYLAG